MEGEMMTVQEIEERFDSEWVLVENPQTDEHLRVLRGEVICHSKSRDEVDRVLLRRRPRSAAMLYTGEIPDDAVVVL